MPIKSLVAVRQEKEGSFLAETFDMNTIAEMERALAKACESLPDELNGHDYRRFIASKIIERVSVGEKSFGAMVLAAMSAIHYISQHRDFAGVSGLQ